jgi:hypothetical protein
MVIILPVPPQARHSWYSTRELLVILLESLLDSSCIGVGFSEVGKPAFGGLLFPIVIPNVVYRLRTVVNGRDGAPSPVARLSAGDSQVAGVA